MLRQFIPLDDGDIDAVLDVLGAWCRQRSVSLESTEGQLAASLALDLFGEISKERFRSAVTERLDALVMPRAEAHPSSIIDFEGARKQAFRRDDASIVVDLKRSQLSVLLEQLRAIANGAPVAQPSQPPGAIVSSLASAVRTRAFEPSGNAILDALPPRDMDALRGLLQSVTVSNGKPVVGSSGNPGSIFFPVDCVISIDAVHEEKSAGIGMVGREGITRFGAGSDDGLAPFRLRGQYSGSAWKLTEQDFDDAVEHHPALRRLAALYGKVLHCQIGHTAFANSQFDLPQRLARLLLMLKDRVGTPTLLVTQEELATALCVKRLSVADAVRTLERERVIRSTPGELNVTDRKALIRLAGGCYGAAEAEQVRRMTQDAGASSAR